MQGRSCRESCVADEKWGHRSIDSLDGAAEGTGEHLQLGRRHDGPVELANEFLSPSFDTGVPGAGKCCFDGVDELMGAGSARYRFTECDQRWQASRHNGLPGRQILIDLQRIDRER